MINQFEKQNLAKHSVQVEQSHVFETSEFVFIYAKKNRPIEEAKVVEFMEKFKAGKNFMRELPALIDINTWEILDGQHRIEACKRLGIPFCYRFTTPNSQLSIDQVTEIQANAGWKTLDYIHSNIQQKKQSYVVLKRFITRYNFPPSTAVMLLSGHINDSRKGSLQSTGFYQGNLQITDKNEEYAHSIAKKTQEFGELGLKVHTNRNFIAALCSVMKHPEYNHEQMLDRYAKYGHSLFHPQINTELYIKELEKLYNYKTQQGKRARFI